MTCKKCGAEVANGNMFCTQCGYQFLPPLPQATYMYYIAIIVLGCLLSLGFSNHVSNWLAFLSIPFMAMIHFCFIYLFNFKKMVPGIAITSIIIIPNIFWYSSAVISFMCMIIEIVLLLLTVYLLKKFRKYKLISYIIVSVYALLVAHIAIIGDLIIISSISIVEYLDYYLRDIRIISSISIVLCLLGLYLGKLIHSWLSQRYDI